jgi:hypothetical protein
MKERIENVMRMMSLIMMLLLVPLAGAQSTRTQSEAPTQSSATSGAGQMTPVPDAAGNQTPAPVQNTAAQQTTPAAIAPEHMTRAQAKETYDRIAAQVKAGDEAADWTTLRFVAERADLYGKFDESTTQGRMYSALGSREWSTALYEAQQILSRNIANGNAHYVAMIAYEQLGDKAHADAEDRIVTAIAHSIFGDRNGRSEDSAWVTTSVDEEYFVLRVLGLKPQSQSLAQKDGKAYDEMKVVDAKDPGHEFVLWFDTTFSMQQLADVPGRHPSKRH